MFSRQSPRVAERVGRRAWAQAPQSLAFASLVEGASVMPAGGGALQKARCPPRGGGEMFDGKSVVIVLFVIGYWSFAAAGATMPSVRLGREPNEVLRLTKKGPPPRLRCCAAQEATGPS